MNEFHISYSHAEWYLLFPLMRLHVHYVYSEAKLLKNERTNKRVPLTKLLEICAERELVVENCLLRKNDVYKYTRV